MIFVKEWDLMPSCSRYFTDSS